MCTISLQIVRKRAQGDGADVLVYAKSSTYGRVCRTGEGKRKKEIPVFTEVTLRDCADSADSSVFCVTLLRA